MTLDDIDASQTVTMTPALRRLFLAEGCDPACHACGKKLRDGTRFQLVPHSINGTEPMRDEMVHVKCGAAGLIRRDRREAKPRARTGGYSRPSKGRP